MTCIVATRSRKGVIIGGDSLGSDGYGSTVRQDPKVGRVGEYLFGFCGSFRVGQVLLFDFDPPEPSRKTAPEIYRFLVAEFIPKLRETMLGAGVLKIEDKIEEFDGAAFIIGIHSHMFYVEEDLQVGWPNTPYFSVGSGEDYAMGAMYNAYKQKKRGEDLLMAGLNAAEQFSVGVGGPFIFESNY